MRLSLLLVALSLSCAGNATKPKATPKTPPPKIEVKEDPLLTILEQSEDAGQMIGIGLAAVDKNEYELAIKAFRKAVGTNMLNEAGKVLSYWNIFVCSLNLEQESMDDLHSFIVISEDLLANRDRYGDFADKFDLANKLDKARQLMEIAWECYKKEDGCETDSGHVR